MRDGNKESISGQKRDTKWQKELRVLGKSVVADDLEWWRWRNQPWPEFLTEARKYFAPYRDLIHSFPDAEQEITQLFSRKHEKGERVRVWDICGMADARSIGADETDSLTRVLPENHPLKQEPDHTAGFRVFEADIFTKEALDPLINRANERGAPTLITFFPMGGFSYSGQTEHPFAGRMLAYQLHRALEALAPGGHIYFQNPYWGHPNNEDFNRLKKMVGRYGDLAPNESNRQFYRIIKFDQGNKP